MLITPSIPVAADIIHLLNLLARVGWSLRCRTSGGSIDGAVSRRGIVDSAGVLDRGKGTGWIAWKPGRSRSRPRESEPAIGSPVEQ